MNVSPFSLPPALGALLQRLPAQPGSVLLVTALNLGVTRQLQTDTRQFLLHRKLRIQVRDARLCFDFSWSGQRFVACPPLQPTDLVISASLYDFLRLAQRQEDPDTLFFSRRLSMEGDTELGLVLKNALDAMELPVLDLRRWSPLQLLARIGPRAQAAGIHPRHSAGKNDG